MDGSTDRCPQCGAAIRPSARYCVTCGVKLPETAASTYPAAATGWAARDESSVPSSDATSAWAMPAAHPDDAQSDSVNPAQPETAATSPAGADEALPESDDTVSEPASAQGLNAATTEPEVEPT